MVEKGRYTPGQGWIPAELERDTLEKKQQAGKSLSSSERDRLNALKGPEEMRKEQERIIQKRKSARLGPDQEKKDPGFYL